MLKKVVVLGPESTGKSTLCEMLAQHFNTLWCPEFAREYLLTNGRNYDFDDLLTIAKGQVALEDEYKRMVQPGDPSYSIEGGKMTSPEFGDGAVPGMMDSRLSELPNFHPTEGNGSLNAPDSLKTEQSEGRHKDFSTNQLLFIDTDQYVMKVWCEYVFNDCHNWILRRIAERKYDLYLLCKPDLPWVKDELREYPDEKPRQQLYHIYRDILLNQPVIWAEISGSYNQRFEIAKNAVMTLL